jgi:hypothetical protein
MSDPSEENFWHVVSGSVGEPRESLHLSRTMQHTSEAGSLDFLRAPDKRDLKTYVVIDPTLRTAISGLFDLDVVDVKAQSLFDGRAAEENKDVAPYILDATVPATDQVSRFNQTFLADHWGQNTGIVVRSHATFEEVRKHFRRFTKLRREGTNGWFFFRFWDPRVASVYLRTIQDNAERAEQWFGRGLIDSFVIEENAGQQVSTFRANRAFERSNDPIRSVVLSDWEMRPFRVTAYDRDVERMAMALKKDFQAELKSYSSENIVTLIKPTLMRFHEIGFRRKENLHVIAAWGVFYGASFVEKDHQGVLAQICGSNMSEHNKFKALKSRMAELGQPEAHA